MCSCPDAFLSLRSCAVEVVGVSGSMPVFGIGTVVFVIRTSTGLPVVAMLHDCLLSQGSSFNLLSVSQFQSSGLNSVDFVVGSPHLCVTTATASTLFPLVLHDGLYNFSAEPILPNDDRFRTLPRFNWTPPSAFLSSPMPGVSPSLVSVPPWLTLPRGTGSPVLPSVPSSLGTWSLKLFAGSTLHRRILAFPVSGTTPFDSELRTFCDGFLSPVAAPPARKTYDPANPVHMADLSVRFMGAGDERLRRILELNRGLLPTTGRVPVHPFPQGKFRQGKTPRVNKGKVHHLHRAAICEVVFTDTFDTGESTFRYGQAFVDYRSRWGDVIPLRSRTQVGWSFGEFCCRNFTPLILVRDNISENTGGALMAECHLRGVKSAFICPYTPQQDQAENFLGRVTTMASYAMVYAGAPLFFWRWAIVAAVFVSNITATYYSRERIWSTPYTLLGVRGAFPRRVFGCPFWLWCLGAA